MNTHLQLQIVLKKLMATEYKHFTHNSLLQGYQNLQKRYAKLKDAPPAILSSFIASSPERIAYLLMRMPATQAVAAKILKELFNLKIFAEAEPLSLLDLGSGTGAVLWAAMAYCWQQISAVDQDPDLIALARQLALQNGNEFWRRVDWHQRNIQQLANFAMHDVVILSYVLIEFDEESMRQVLARAWQLTQKALVIIEPGTRRSFHHCLKARDYLIQQGAFIAAPCSHQQSCPKANDWCHFVERIDRTFWQQSFKGGSLGFEDEPYIYLIATKNPEPPVGARILNPPIKRPGYLRFELCAPDQVQEKIISKKQPEFKTAKKKHWGDVL